MPDMPQIDTDKCNGCGLCVNACGCGIITLVDCKATIVPHNGCDGCRNWCTLCEDICPSKAIYCSFEVIIENNPGNA